MKVKDALEEIKKNDKSLKNELVFILCECLSKDKAWLYLNLDYDFDESFYRTCLDKFLKDKLAFEYIFNKVSFYGLDFKIEEGVLIPRFDSEILLNLCLKELCVNSYKNILEIGFGSGVLSIVLALKLALKISACDINEKALHVALQNAKLHKVEHLLDFKLSSYDKLNCEYDFIFSNPPYIASTYPLDAYVKNEPSSALIGGDKGYEFLQNLISFAKERKAKCLACEFGYDQKEILEDILKQNGFKATFYKDLQGYDRAFIAFS